VFKLDPAGKETVLYSFLGAPEDGRFPAFATLSRDATGNLYGVTPDGGRYCQNQTYCGIVFMLDPTGKETVLHYFTGTKGDGAFPTGGVVRDESGNLYGTTGGGGDFSACYRGCGIVFKLTP
jgi:hypothetical protein